jgi:uncharacterized membrane protein
MEAYHAALETTRLALLVIGSLVIAGGIVRSVPEARGPGGRVRVARRITGDAALGLEYFVGATILNLVLTPTWMAVAATAATILVRKLITLSLGRVAHES